MITCYELNNIDIRYIEHYTIEILYLDESQKIDFRSRMEWKAIPWCTIYNKKAPTDAECVKLMKEAGAVIIATSNIPEINRWQETRNNIIGQTNNPYDTRRTVGGSSGGEG